MPEQCSPAAVSDVAVNSNLASLPSGKEGDVVNAPTPLLEISEQFPAELDSMIELDSPSLTSSAIGYKAPYSFKSSNSNKHYKFHPTINGNNIFLYYRYSHY